jgi:hypothetical protein
MPSLIECKFLFLVAKLTARIRMHIKYGDIDPRVSGFRFLFILKKN